MADKILKITFNGICTLTPRPSRPPRQDDPPLDKAFVLMVAHREPTENDWGVTVPEHFPFIFVPVSILLDPIPKPDKTTNVPELGVCNIYFIDHARVVVDTPPTEGIRYYIDHKHPLAERPGSDDVAPENDIRWLADFRDILQGPAPLKSTIGELNGPNIGPEVAVVVELQGGLLQSGFSCKSVQPKTFKDVHNKVVPGLKRVLAPEFFIDMSYAETTTAVKIQLKPLRPPESAVGLGDEKELILKWPEKKKDDNETEETDENTEETGEEPGKADKEPQVIEMRMGNDAKNETTAYLGKPKRCNARKKDPLTGKVILIPRDNDFFLHYQIIDSGGKPGPLPQSNIQQITINGCKGAH